MVKQNTGFQSAGNDSPAYEVLAVIRGAGTLGVFHSLFFVYLIVLGVGCRMVYILHKSSASALNPLPPFLSTFAGKTRHFQGKMVSTLGWFSEDPVGK